MAPKDIPGKMKKLFTWQVRRKFIGKNLEISEVFLIYFLLRIWWKKHVIILAILCDCFVMVMWPFQRLSDLQRSGIKRSVRSPHLPWNSRPSLHVYRWEACARSKNGFSIRKFVAVLPSREKITLISHKIQPKKNPNSHKQDFKKWKTPKWSI